MAEEHNNPAVDPTRAVKPDGQASNPSGETEKMVSLAEMQRRLKASRGKARLKLHKKLLHKLLKSTKQSLN